MWAAFFYRQQYPLALARRTSDSAAESTYLSSLATYQLRMGRLPRVRRLLTQALAISSRQHAVRNQANQLVLFALYYNQPSQPKLAEAAVREALRLARQCGYLERVLDAYNLPATAAADRQDYRMAYEWNMHCLELNDTLNNRETIQTLAAAQVSHETQERARRLRELTRQHWEQAGYNLLLGSAVAILSLGLLASGYFYRNLRRSRAALAANHEALERASAELRRVAVFKDKLYAIVAHDLRGPVTAFAGVTGLIDSYLVHDDQDGLARLPGVVRQAADSLNQLLDNVLSWAVSQTGELDCRPAPLLVSELLTECQLLYQTTTSAPADLYILADRNMTRRWCFSAVPIRGRA